MDTSHVALVVLLLRSQGFEHFRCDRNMTIGMNVQSLAKVVKCAGNDDVVTLKANDKADVLSLLFESPSMLCIALQCLPMSNVRKTRRRSHLRV
jgi:proliferating cell nuclear antigen